MAQFIEMIQLSPTMEEGRLVKWLKKEGDAVSMGDLLAEVETDKATMEMESYHDGVLLKILVPEGDAATVGSKLGIIGKAGEDISAMGSDTPAAAAPTEEAPTEEAPAVATDPSTPAPTEAQASPAEAPPATDITLGKAEGEGTGNGRLKASPVARKVAGELGVDLTTIAGSGPGGRVVRRDVEAANTATAPAAAAANEVPLDAPSTPKTPVAAKPAGASTLEGSREALSPMRKAIARNLSVAWQAPSFVLTREIAMDAALAFRAQLNTDLAAADIKTKVSVNDMVIRAAALALIDVPEMHSAYGEDGIFRYTRAHIGMAVALEGGLITPVIRDAHIKSLGAIATEARALALRARDKKLKPDEYTDATFSISNLGMMEIEEFTAVLNPPAAGILAVGAVLKKPIVTADGQLAVGERMRVTLTCDHRAVDGAVGARWLQRFVGYLQNPMTLAA